MKSLSAPIPIGCGDCLRGGGDVRGVGTFWSGLGDFVQSGFGQALVGAGLSIGTAFALSKLDLAPAPRGNQGGALSGGSQVNPAGSVYNPLASAPVIIQQPAPAATPAWLLPAAIGGGVLVLVLLMQRR